jgi:hypothetical protein
MAYSIEFSSRAARDFNCSDRRVSQELCEQEINELMDAICMTSGGIGGSQEAHVFQSIQSLDG